MTKKTIGFAARPGWPLRGLAAFAAALSLVPAATVRGEGETVSVAVRAGAAVKDAVGNNLTGGGVNDPDACIFQLICAGANGIPDTPPSAGAVGGDDTVIGESRFCEGSNSGKFNVIFDIPADQTNSLFFARAWNGASFQTSALYGDSAVKPVRDDGWDGPEIIFDESWSLSDTVAGADPLLDENGDGIPDAWAAAFRPDLAPSSATAPQSSPTVSEPGDFFETSRPPNDSANADGNPSRVFVSDKFVFVLETYCHRVAVYDRAAGTNLFHYGATGGNNSVTDAAGRKYVDPREYAPGTGDGAFNLPEGMALDTFSGQSRFAVADTGNCRVQVFSFDADSGEISFVAAFGTASPTNGTSAAEGTFSQPLAVAFTESGDLLVADTGNHRVARLTLASGGMSWAESFQFTEDDTITGLCADGEGFWVANKGNGRQCVSFHTFSGFSAEPTVSFGGQHDGEFSNPADIQTWTVGGRLRLAVADRGGSRVRILDPQAAASGAMAEIFAVADIGSISDDLLQKDQKLFHPGGVFPVADENLIYVADTGNNRIAWYGARMDGDGDGMDDLWEDASGLDSTIDDSRADADGDGLSNLGEYLSGCDPQNTDSDGDGKGDMFEMVQVADPLDPGSTPSATSIALPAITADPTTVDPGTGVTITATFESAVSGPGTYALFDADGAEIASGRLVFDGSATATADVDTADFPSGAVSAVFTFAECDPAGLSTNAFFTVTGDEEYEADGWPVSSIAISADGATATLTWDAPTENLPSNGSDLLFRIYYRPSLVDGDWDGTAVPANDISVAQGAPGSAEIDISAEPFSLNPDSAFFRLEWLNKEKE